MEIRDITITGFPSGVLTSLMNTIDAIIARRNVEYFYIGRTNDPYSTMIRHGQYDYDQLILIYTTSSTEHVKEVEDFLIKEYKKHPKNDNNAAHSGGNISNIPPQYVYIAIQYYQ